MYESVDLLGFRSLRYLVRDQESEDIGLKGSKSKGSCIKVTPCK